VLIQSARLPQISTCRCALLPESNGQRDPFALTG